MSRRGCGGTPVRGRHLARHGEGGHDCCREARRRTNPLMRRATRARDRRILFGGGAARLAFALGEPGARPAAGIGVFIPNQAVRDHGVVVHRQALVQTEGPCDVVRFHHGFAHLPDPQATRGPG